MNVAYLYPSRCCLNGIAKKFFKERAAASNRKRRGEVAGVALQPLPANSRGLTLTYNKTFVQTSKYVSEDYEFTELLINGKLG